MRIFYFQCSIILFIYLFNNRKPFVRVCSVKDLLMNVGDQFSKDEVSKEYACDT